jgi:hypothetical protein
MIDLRDLLHRVYPHSLALYSCEDLDQLWRYFGNPKRVKVTQEQASEIGQVYARRLLKVPVELVEA